MAIVAILTIVANAANVTIVVKVTKIVTLTSVVIVVRDFLVPSISSVDRIRDTMYPWFVTPSLISFSLHPCKQEYISINAKYSKINAKYSKIRRISYSLNFNHFIHFFSYICIS